MSYLPISKWDKIKYLWTRILSWLMTLHKCHLCNFLHRRTTNSTEWAHSSTFNYTAVNISFESLRHYLVHKQSYARLFIVRPDRFAAVICSRTPPSSIHQHMWKINNRKPKIGLDCHTWMPALLSPSLFRSPQFSATVQCHHSRHRMLLLLLLCTCPYHTLCV